MNKLKIFFSTVFSTVICSGSVTLYFIIFKKYFQHFGLFIDLSELFFISYVFLQIPAFTVLKVINRYNLHNVIFLNTFLYSIVNSILSYPWGKDGFYYFNLSNNLKYYLNGVITKEGYYQLFFIFIIAGIVGSLSSIVLFYFMKILKVKNKSYFFIDFSTNKTLSQ